jgi:hypothetical protein
MSWILEISVFEIDTQEKDYLDMNDLDTQTLYTN